MFNVITSFINKLELYKSNVSRGELRKFPNFKQNQVSTEELLRYSCHLENINRDIVERFADVINLEIPEWIIRPCSCDLQKVPIELQESLIDLRSDDVMKSSFPEQYYNILWCNVADKYPALWARAQIMILSFPTSYLVEKGFSAVVGLLTKKMNKLEITNRGDLRLLNNLFPQNPIAMALRFSYL